MIQQADDECDGQPGCAAKDLAPTQQTLATVQPIRIAPVIEGEQEIRCVEGASVDDRQMSLSTSNAKAAENSRSPSFSIVTEDISISEISDQDDVESFVDCDVSVDVNIQKRDRECRINTTYSVSPAADFPALAPSADEPNQVEDSESDDDSVVLIELSEPNHDQSQDDSTQQTTLDQVSSTADIVPKRPCSKRKKTDVYPVSAEQIVVKQEKSDSDNDSVQLIYQAEPKHDQSQGGTNRSKSSDQVSTSVHNTPKGHLSKRQKTDRHPSFKCRFCVLSFCSEDELLNHEVGHTTDTRDSCKTGHTQSPHHLSHTPHQSKEGEVFSSFYILSKFNKRSFKMFSNNNSYQGKWFAV